MIKTKRMEKPVFCDLKFVVNCVVFTPNEIIFSFITFNYCIFTKLLKLSIDSRLISTHTLLIKHSRERILLVKFRS